MIATWQRRPLIALLALAAAILLVAIGIETGFGTRLGASITSAPVKPAAAPEANLLPSLVAVAPEQAYPETAARPLFVPTRRPAPAAPTAGAQGFERGQYVLQGVIAVGSNRTAMLREKASGRIHRVEAGKEMNGITIEKIEPTAVTLAMNGERETLNLTVQRAGAAAGGPAGAPPNAPIPPAQADAGPFGAATQPAATAGAAQATPSGRSPLTRGQPAAAGAVPPRPATANANAPSTQPMTPEELLARRRARRSQPTQ